MEVDETEAIPFEDSEWFKTLETTPGEMIVANRDLCGWSQVTLGEIFGTDPAAFFDFFAGEKKVK